MLNGELAFCTELEETLVDDGSRRCVNPLGPFTRAAQVFRRKTDDAVVRCRVRGRKALRGVEKLKRRACEDDAHFHDPTDSHIIDVGHLQIDPHDVVRRLRIISGGAHFSGSTCEFLILLLTCRNLCVWG